MAAGYVLYTEKAEPDIVRSHGFDRVEALSGGLLILETSNGRRLHRLDEYLDFGIFPHGPANQEKRPGTKQEAESA